VQASEAEQRERGDAARQDNAKLLSDLQEVSQLIELLEVRPISPMHLP